MTPPYAKPVIPFVTSPPFESYLSKICIKKKMFLQYIMQEHRQIGIVWWDAQTDLIRHGISSSHHLYLIADEGQ